MSHHVRELFCYEPSQHVSNVAWSASQLHVFCPSHWQNFASAYWTYFRFIVSCQHANHPLPMHCHPSDDGMVQAKLCIVVSIHYATKVFLLKRLSECISASLPFVFLNWTNTWHSNLPKPKRNIIIWCPK